MQEQEKWSKEHDLLEEWIMILVTWSTVTVEKVENIGTGESGVMYCIFREVENVERNFSIFL